MDLLSLVYWRAAEGKNRFGMEIGTNLQADGPMGKGKFFFRKKLLKGILEKLDFKRLCTKLFDFELQKMLKQRGNQRKRKKNSKKNGKIDQKPQKIIQNPEKRTCSDVWALSADCL